MLKAKVETHITNIIYYIFVRYTSRSYNWYRVVKTILFAAVRIVFYLLAN